MSENLEIPMPGPDLTDALLGRTQHLADCQTWLREVLGSMPECLVAVDERGTIIAANPAAREMLGEPPGGLSGTPLGVPVGNNGARLQLRTARGEDLLTEVHTLVPGPTPGPVSLLVLREAGHRGQRENIQEQLEVLGYAIGHDLREPLRMVAGYLELLEDRAGDRLEGDLADFLDYAREGAHRLDAMLASLRDYARAAKGEITFDPVDLEAVVEDVATNLNLVIEDQGARIERGTLPTVLGERALLTQLVQNLVANAIKHQEPGRTPEARIDATAEGHKWRITVEDNGPGIPESEQDRIFEMFKSVGAKNGDATGMGLAICEIVAQRHGTRIEVDSTLGEGTTFSFTLPAARPSQPSPSAPSRVQGDPRS